MKLVFESNEYFTFYDYHISHQQLLIRGELENSNIDLVFEGTSFINSPTSFNGIEVYLLTPENIKDRNIKNPFNSNIFLLKSERNEHYIVSNILRIYSNKLKFYESSIDMTGKGQEKLIWINNQNNNFI